MAKRKKVFSYRLVTKLESTFSRCNIVVVNFRANEAKAWDINMNEVREKYLFEQYLQDPAIRKS